MCIKTALFAATLAFSLSVHADTKKATSPPKPPKQTTPKPAKQGTVQTDSFGFGTALTSQSATSGGVKGKATGGPPDVGGGSKTDPCTLANPPKSCKQGKPAH